MYEQLFEYGKQRAPFTAWIFSDVHSPSPEVQQHRFDVVLHDFESLGKPADMIWYLGDAVLGNAEERAAAQIETFDRLGIPLCYVTGNHDYDSAFGLHGKTNIELPFSGAVRRHPGWYTTASEEDTWFRLQIRNTMVYFFSDHMASDASWIASSNTVTAGAGAYPYGPRHFDAIRHDMETCPAKQIITASHYAFPGGNRGGGLLSLLQPLPSKVRLHLYGHAHIGKYANEERTFSQIQWIDWQDIPQVDIASFGGANNTNYRSVFLQMYDDDTLGLFFRNHTEQRFYAAFFPSDHSCEPPDGYSQHAVKIDPAAVLPPQCPGMIRDGFGPAST